MKKEENPPYEDAMEKRRWWKRSFKLLSGHLYITFSNCRVKKRPSCCDHRCSQRVIDNMRDIKGKLYAANGGICPECHQHHEIRNMELHHVLPWGRFPELRAKKANLMLLCHDCHREVHCNPWRNIELMKAKAEELGVKLEERYALSEV